MNVDGSVFKKNAILYGKALESGNVFDINIYQIMNTDGNVSSVTGLIVFDEKYSRGLLASHTCRSPGRSVWISPYADDGICRDEHRLFPDESFNFLQHGVYEPDPYGHRRWILQAGYIRHHCQRDR